MSHQHLPKWMEEQSARRCRYGHACARDSGGEHAPEHTERVWALVQALVQGSVAEHPGTPPVRRDAHRARLISI